MEDGWKLWLICTVKQGMKAMPKPHTTCDWLIMEMNGLGQIGNPVSPVQGVVGPPSISGSLPF